MPRKRTARRGRVGAATAAAAVPGELRLSTAALAFAVTAGGNATTYTAEAFDVDNVGAGSWAGPVFGVSYATGSGWLSLALSVDASGTVTAIPTVDPSGLAAGSYTATVTVTDANVSNSGQTVTVDLTVAAAAPTLAVFPSALSVLLADETATGATVTTTLSNSGTGTIATPSAGTITGAGAGYISAVDFTDNGDDTWTVTVTPTATGGTVGGPYAASIPIVSAGATNTGMTFTVQVTVTAAASAAYYTPRFTLPDFATYDPADDTISGEPMAAPALGSFA